MIADLFANPGMIILSTIVIILDVLSLVILFIGLFSYRTIVRGHLAFFALLHHAGKQARKKPILILFWIYLLSTLLLIFLTNAIFIWLPHLS